MAIIQYIILLLFFLVYYYFSRLIIRYCITHTTFYKIIRMLVYYIVKVFVYNFFVLIMLITTIFQDIIQTIRAPTKC